MLAAALKMSEGQLPEQAKPEGGEKLTEKEKEEKAKEINKLFEDENFMKDVLAVVGMDEEEIGEVLKKEGQLKKDDKDKKKD